MHTQSKQLPPTTSAVLDNKVYNFPYWMILNTPLDPDPNNHQPFVFDARTLLQIHSKIKTPLQFFVRTASKFYVIQQQ